LCTSPSCFLEVKRKGTYQSPEQKEFQAQAKKAGALYGLVRPIDDVQAIGLYLHFPARNCSIPARTFPKERYLRCRLYPPK
jgi:hypothetical protein